MRVGNIVDAGGSFSENIRGTKSAGARSTIEVVKEASFPRPPARTTHSVRIGHPGERLFPDSSSGAMLSMRDRRDRLQKLSLKCAETVTSITTVAALLYSHNLTFVGE